MMLLKSKYTKNVPDMAGMMYTSNMKDGTGLVYDSKQNKRNYLLDLYANYAHVYSMKTQFQRNGGIRLAAFLEEIRCNHSFSGRKRTVFAKSL